VPEITLIILETPYPNNDSGYVLPINVVSIIHMDIRGVNAGLKVLNTAKIIVLSPINIYAPP